MNHDVIKEAEMLEEIRSLLDLTIEDFVSQMDWPNSKYYDYIKNGRKRNGSEEPIKSRPTIDKIFNGLNFALNHHTRWRDQSMEIKAIVNKYIFPEEY